MEVSAQDLVFAGTLDELKDKGRLWTGETVAKFLSSAGAKRYRTGGKGWAR